MKVPHSGVSTFSNSLSSPINLQACADDRQVACLLAAENTFRAP